MNIYKYFLDGVPEYLARYYWWAYLWDKGIWFFDHQPIINAILFGQYKSLVRHTLDRSLKGQQWLQLGCVYGSLTPKLHQRVESLHVADVAMLQLQLARRKTTTTKSKQNKKSTLLLARMNAESLAYTTDSFDGIFLFFMLHELPVTARIKMLDECLRVVKSGGKIIITEYAETPHKHILYRFLPFRWLLTQLEPFLASFWNESLRASLQSAAIRNGMRIQKQHNKQFFFYGFYRVQEFNVLAKL